MQGLRHKARHKSRRDFPEFQAELVVGTELGTVTWGEPSAETI